MTTGSSSTEPASPSPAKNAGGGMVQVIFLVILLLVGAFFGGYYLGTQAQFSNMSNPAANTNPILALFDPSSHLKKWYWIHTKGWDRAGYLTTVVVNGQLVGKFFKPDVDLDITKFVRPGKNRVSFSAKSLPAEQRDDSSSAYLTIEIRSADKKDGETNKFQNGDMLVDYTRQVTDTDDYNDIKDFETIE